jgi:hypothetical protein
MNTQPKIFVSISMWYKSKDVNICFDVEHGRNHLITDHCGRPLTGVREITNDVNESQGTLVNSNKCE